MTKKTLRRDTKRYSKLGKNRKKIQRWRKPTGRDNKIRLKRKGYTKPVSIGSKSKKGISGRINGLKPFLIKDINDLKNPEKDSIFILSKRLGARKKIEIIRKAQKSKLKILNINGEFK